MDIKNAIKTLLKDNNKTQTWLADKMGYADPSGIAQTLQRNAITLDTLSRICDIMDYEISIQPKRRAGSRPQGQIVIESAKGERK